MNENANKRMATEEEYRKKILLINEAVKYYTSLCDAYCPDRDCDRCEMKEECYHE